MSDTLSPRQERTPNEAHLDADQPINDCTPPHADDFNITDPQQWLDLCA